MKTTEERLARIEQILIDNKQHERLCPAHITASDMSTPFGGMFMAQRDAACDCWISGATPSSDPTIGYAIYDRIRLNLWDKLHPSRYDAVEFLLWNYSSLSRDPKSENYYNKDYMVAEATLKPKTEVDETKES